MPEAPLEVRSESELQTVALGERVGRLLRPGDLLILSGPLGAGKTVLARGMAIGAGADPQLVRSPTFVLHHVYPARGFLLHHLDLYRLGGGDLRFLDIEGLLETGPVLVEWGELGELGELAPLRITLAAEEGVARLIRLEVPVEPRIADAWRSGPLAT